MLPGQLTAAYPGVDSTFMGSRPNALFRHTWCHITILCMLTFWIKVIFRILLLTNAKIASERQMLVIAQDQRWWGIVNRFF